MKYLPLVNIKQGTKSTHRYSNGNTLPLVQLPFAMCGFSLQTRYDGGWYYLEKGYAVTSQWRKDSIGWCYLSESGRMVTNDFVADSMGLCYIGGEGYMLEVTDWQLHNDQWYYLEKGYAVTNDWRLDSKGWCYLGEDGAMLTSTWFKDSVGWCYIDENGYCLANGTYEVNGHEYTFDADGRIQGEPIQE